MNRIDKIRISLLKRIGEEKLGQNDYTVKCSSYMNIKEYIKKTYGSLSDSEGEELISSILELSFEDLLKKNTNEVDHIGIWITLDTGEIFENSTELSVINSMKEFGNEVLSPVFEFFKMTLDKYESQNN